MRPTCLRTIAYNRPLAAGAALASRSFVRNTVVMVVLAILAAATWIATWERQDASPPVDPVADAEPLGYYARGARIAGTDEDGRLAYRIVADRLDELPGEEHLQLTGVNVDYHAADEIAWSVSAASARYSRDGSQLDLAGNVELQSAPTDGSEPVTIITEKLLFSPDTSVAESAESVEILVGDWQLRSAGLRTHLKGDTLELESPVHGTLRP
jgi:LPS export ABC transporter protein LptC